MWRWHRLSQRTAAAIRTRSRFVPILEPLETRTALSGNVTAFVCGGNLVVSGDNEGAIITVSQSRVGQITLTGDSTTVNGLAKPVTFSGVTKDLRINFGSGNDWLQFDEAKPIILHGDLSINGGQGNNVISTIPGSSKSSLRIGGSLAILNLPGDTEVTTLTNLNVRRGVQIQNQGGDSLVSIDIASQDDTVPRSNTIGGNLVITNGPGQYNDTELSGTIVKGNVQITNQGANAITNVGNSRYSAANTIGGTLQILDSPGEFAQSVIWNTKIGDQLQVAEGGLGSGTLLLISSQVKRDTVLQVPDGGNAVSVTDATFCGAFRLQTGSVADQISIGTGPSVDALTRLGSYTYIENGIPMTLLTPQMFTVGLPSGGVTFKGQTRMNFGGGDDALNLATGAEVAFRRSAILDGAAGDNTAVVNTANLPNLPTLENFWVSNG